MIEAIPAAEGTGVKTADKVFAYLAALLVLCIIVQFFLAGLGVWGIDQHKIGDAKHLDPHRAFANVVGLVAILMFIAALVSRTSKPRIWVSILIAVLAVAVQSLLAAGGEHQHWVGGLHVLDGLVILGLAGWMHKETRPLLKRG
jgi:L-asparagine transporter-like permease